MAEGSGRTVRYVLETIASYLPLIGTGVLGAIVSYVICIRNVCRAPWFLTGARVLGWLWLPFLSAVIILGIMIPRATRITGDLELPFVIALGIYVMIGLIITRGITADSGLTILQKLIQTLIIWLIPVFGMCVVLLMQGNNHSRAEMKSLVPFPFYLVADSRPGDGSLAGPVQDGAGDHCGTDALDGD